MKLKYDANGPGNKSEAALHDYKMGHERNESVFIFIQASGYLLTYLLFASIMAEFCENLTIPSY
jgi:hypothetical protein